MRLANGAVLLASVIAALGLGALALPPGASARFTNPSTFDGSLTPPGALACPGQLGFDPGGGTPVRPAAVYVADPCANSDTTGDANLYAFSADGQSLDTTFAGGSVENFPYESNTECFDTLSGAVVDTTAGDLYLADGDADALFDFSYTGSDQNQLGNPCAVVSGPRGGPILRAGDTVASPQGLAIYGGNLYVAEGTSGLAETALGLDSGTVSTVPTASGDTDPIGIAIDPHSGEMFVLDGQNGLVDEYTSSGSFIGTFVSGLTNPTAIALDPVAHVVYIANGANVDTYSESTGAALLQTPARSNEFPQGVALDTTNHVLYIADSTTGTSGGLVERFDYTPAPACKTSTSSTKGGVATDPALSCTDLAGAPVTYAISSNPAHGTLSDFNPATGGVTYTPDSGYDGSDSFSYVGSSVDGSSDPTTVTVNTSGPTCAPETLSTAYQQPLAITLACSDSASPVASYRILTGPSDGGLSTPTSGGALTYTPNSLFVGVDSFTFDATNADGFTSAPETVTLYVGTQLPPPVQGESANLYFSYGAVDVLLPGQTTPIPLTAGIQAPLGSVIDATNGGAGVFVTIDGQQQSANFFSGEFKLTQTSPTNSIRSVPGGDAVVTQSVSAETLLNLIGQKIPKVRCAIHSRSFSGPFSLGAAQGLGPRASLLLRASKKFHEKGKPTRQLWGSGHGNFTMVGNGSSASVRGTEWAVFDYPDGTLTFDYTDSVAVYDFHRKKTVIITAGHYYFAALGGLAPCGK
jgi:hypothetical protein